MTYKKLQPMPAKALQLLNQIPFSWVNTFELRNGGVTSPPQSISNLIARGAIIDKEFRVAADHLGIEHNKVAHYRFRGWISNE